MSTPKLQSKPSADERRWQVESAMSTLQRAAEIQKDRRLMADVKKSASNLMGVINKVKPTVKRK